MANVPGTWVSLFVPCLWAAGPAFLAGHPFAAGACVALVKKRALAAGLGRWTWRAAYAAQTGVGSAVFVFFTVLALLTFQADASSAVDVFFIKVFKSV